MRPAELHLTYAKRVFLMHRAGGAGNENRWNYLWVVEQLRQEILGGMYRAGKRLPGEPALAQRFGVSRVTVARALEILHQSNLVFRVRGSGTYVQRDVARGAAAMTIGYLVSDASALRNTPTGVSLEAAHRRLEERGHGLRLILRGELGKAREPAVGIRRMVRAGQIHGLIIATAMLVRRVQSIGQVLPTVCELNDQLPDNVLGVAVDFTLGYFLATRHLLDLGHRRIGLLGAGTMSNLGYRAQQAFRLALQLADADLDACPIGKSGFDPERYRSEIDDMLRAHSGLTGVVCADDVAALAAMQAAQDRGLCVPEHFSVVGCNDLPAGVPCQVPLTTLRIDFAEMGRRAVDMLLARMFGQEGSSRRYVRPELVVRGSTAPPRT